MDTKKIIDIALHFSEVYNISPDEVLYVLECLIAQTYSASMPAVIRMDGKVILVKNNKVHCVLPGIKTLQNAFKGLDDELRRVSFEKNKKESFDQEKLIYGKIVKKKNSGVFEVHLFNGLVKGEIISPKLAKGVFNASVNGNKGETYTVGRHYLFYKTKLVGSNVYLTRKSNEIASMHCKDVIKKISEKLKIKVAVWISHVESSTQSIFIKHTKNMAFLVPLIKKRMNEKCAYKVFATEEGDF